MEQKNIAIEKLEVNKGQIEGLPKNPRFIRDERFNALKKSIEDAPEMLTLRELLVYPFNGKYVVIGGNMRLRACKDLGYKELPCKVLDETTKVEKLREYTVKDNISFGDTDWSLILDWDIQELENFGFEGLKKKSEKQKTFEEELMSITNEDCLYPIVPEFDEKHELFIIVSDSEIDSNWLREKLRMNKMKSYKTDDVSKSNVISINDLKDVL